MNGNKSQSNKPVVNSLFRDPLIGKSFAVPVLTVLRTDPDEKKKAKGALCLRRSSARQA